jgi:exopolyphosphatase/pppGpp-phosphohydrolase
MQDRQSPVRAAIDVGSNTIHIVVASGTPTDLDILEDEVDLVRIGESVTENGEISSQKQDQAIVVLRQFKALAEKHGAETIMVLATEAIRKANNSDAFLERVQKETGLTVQIISGTVEATLTFFGATYEALQKPDVAAELAVMDLGGGSTELVMAKRGHIDWKTSLPVGSGALHDRYLPSNPPTADELRRAQTYLWAFFKDISIPQTPPELIVTGGSANSLVNLARQAFHLDEDVSRLSLDDIAHCEGLLSALAAEEIAQRYGQLVGRASILPAGAAILRAVMDRLHLCEITVSPHGIREGALLAYERFGEKWLERVGEEVTEQAQKSEDGNAYEDARKAAAEEPFAASGQRMLHERVKKMLEWQDEVLKNDDSESIHKMRVATRRLRATMDAYESCCSPKQFKMVYRQVKKMANLLGTARDTDVMLQHLQEQHEQLLHEEQAGLRWLIKRLETYREQSQQELEDYFEMHDMEELKRQLETSIKKGASKHGKS